VIDHVNPHQYTGRLDPPGWRWGGNRVQHPASITYRKLGLPVVVATTFAKQAFNSTSAHSIDRLNGLIDYPTQRLWTD
jgi:hypothetical protein